MTMLRADAPCVQPWEVGPTPTDDARWRAGQSEPWDSEESPPDDYFDRKAGESEALDFMERGIRPF